MFDIGFWELVLVGVVTLIVVGPERLPGLARTAGLWLGKARRMIAHIKAEVDQELQLEELKHSLRQQADLNGIQDLTNQVKSIRQDIQEELEDDLGPPPGWRPGAASAPPPPGWTPPAEQPQPTAVKSLESSPTRPEPAAPTVSLDKPVSSATASPANSASALPPSEPPIVN